MLACMILASQGTAYMDEERSEQHSHLSLLQLTQG